MYMYADDVGTVAAGVTDELNAARDYVTQLQTGLVGAGILPGTGPVAPQYLAPSLLQAPTTPSQSATAAPFYKNPIVLLGAVGVAWYFYSKARK